MSIQFGVPGSSFSLMPVVCVPMIRISPASRIAFTRATPRQFSPGRQQPRTVCRVASITVGVGSHRSSSFMAAGMRQTGQAYRIINYRDDEHRGLSLPGSENGANRWLTPPTFVPFPRDWWRNILG